MSQLKEWTASEIEEYDDARLELAEDGKIDCTRVYIKEDVDKVIAELKDIDSKNRSAYYKDLAMMAKDVERQKYKRCLDKANYWVAISFHCVDDKHKQKAEKRHYKWLKLAEKFKEAK